MKIVALYGIPASGKSTIMKKVLERRFSSSLGEKFKWNLVQGVCYEEEKVILLGVYENDHPFGGTDRLSMIAQRDVVRWFKEVAIEKFAGYTVLYEGDRLATPSFLNFLINEVPGEKSFFMVEALPEIVDERHKLRGDKQNEVWIKGRKTKCDRLLSEFFSYFTILENNDEKDLELNVLSVLKALES
jgi:hypothetical protein